MKNPRCYSCNKKLAEEFSGRLVSRCPRCKTVNVFTTALPKPPEPSVVEFAKSG